MRKSLNEIRLLGPFSFSDQGEGLAHGMWGYPQAVGLGLYKKVGWANHGKQISKQLPAMTSSSVPASRSRPCLDSCSELLQC